MKVITANFLQTAEKKCDYPEGERREIAFAGRSNVGKSSMINALLGRRNLVRTSKTPGRTRTLNFFLINESFVFVDLPGYGFAAVPLAEKAKWGLMIETYLQARTELAGVVAIVDARRPPTESDMVLIGYLKHYKIPFIVAATKLDKITRSQMTTMRRSIKETLAGSVPVVGFSAHTGQGKNELWKEIKNLLDGSSIRSS
jgi:GTP-binding protein